MFGKDRLLDALEKALRWAGGAESDISAIAGESATTRFGCSRITQNTREDDVSVCVRVIRDRRIGVASLNSLEEEELKGAVGRAARFALLQKPHPHFTGLPGPAPYPELATYDERLMEETGPLMRAQVVGRLRVKADRIGAQIAGAISPAAGEIAVASTSGVRAYQAFSSVTCHVVATGESGSGYGEGLGRRPGGVDFDAVGERALSKCAMAQDPREIEPGAYDVLLEPAAVAELLGWMGYIGFGARSFIDGTSFLSGRIGRKIMDGSVSMLDDPAHPMYQGLAFDFTGVPRKKVLFIRRGEGAAVVHDLLTSAESGAENTGHALPPDSEGGPLPLSVHMEPGDVPAAGLLTRLERGLAVTRFHYINGLLDVPRALFTGMTRDGAYWVDEGKIRHPVKNLRFTQSMLEAFSSVAALSRELEVHPLQWEAAGACVCPSVLIRNFHFVSKTDY